MILTFLYLYRISFKILYIFTYRVQKFGNVTIVCVFERSILWSSILDSACLIKNIEKNIILWNIITI